MNNNSFRSQILFHQVSQIGLNRGLYLCYVQARSSMEEGMRVIVSNTGPGILPYVKVRDNPHVTSDEWRWITLLGSRHKSSFIARQGMQKTIFHQTTYIFLLLCKSYNVGSGVKKDQLWGSKVIALNYFVFRVRVCKRSLTRNS